MVITLTRQSSSSICDSEFSPRQRSTSQITTASALSELSVASRLLVGFYDNDDADDMYSLRLLSVSNLRRRQNAWQLKLQLQAFAARPIHVPVVTTINSRMLYENQPTNVMTNSSLRLRVIQQQQQQRHFASTATVVSTSSAADTSKIPILLADIGEGIAEVEIMSWMVQVGDNIQEYDPLVQVQSDKATVEITSRYAGRIAQLQGQVGDMVAVGTPLAYIEVAGKGQHSASAVQQPVASISSTTDEMASPLSEKKANESKVDVVVAASVETVVASVETQESIVYDDDDLDDADEQSAVSTLSPSTPLPAGAKVLATPAVRKIAMDNQLNLSMITGTGPQGRILKLDVLRYLEEKALQQQQQQQQIESGKDISTTLPPAVSTTPNKQLPTAEEEDGSKVVPLRGYHRLMVQTMTRALQIPHMVYSDEVNLNSLLELRKELLREQKHRKLDAFPLPVLVFAIKALSLALKEYPMVNSTLNTATEQNNKEHQQLLPTSMTIHAHHNIGIAMDTPRGLAVPVLHRCQDLSLRDMALELERLKLAARSSQLTERDLSGATISLSNIGAIGGTYMSPIITPPQVAILAMGRVQRLPRFVDDNDDDSSSDDDDDNPLRVEAVHVLPISWGGDHRVLDGATLARFSNQWKYYMESPTSMLLHLK